MIGIKVSLPSYPLSQMKPHLEEQLTRCDNILPYFTGDNSYCITAARIDNAELDARRAHFV